MRRASSARVLLACLVACVPSTDDLGPTGAAGFTLQPSSASRGEPFVTADGWTVTVDQLLLLATVSARPTADVEEDPESTGDQLLFSARSVTPVFVPGVPVGEARLRVYFGKLLFDVEPSADPATDLSVRHLLPRFRETADLTFDYRASGQRSPPPPLRAGPSVLVSFHAESGERSLRATFTMAADAGRFVRFPDVLVTADSLVTTPLDVHAEALFHAVPWCGVTPCAVGGTDAAPAPPLLLSPFVFADADGDGVLTVPELVASNPQDSFANELLVRAGSLLQVPAP